MASSVETIKSFLVSLGFKVDTGGLNRFASSIAIQTEAVRELGEGLKASAERVVSFVRNIVEANDSLYFTSQRLQTTAANLKALKYAADQTGGQGFVNTLLSQIQHLKEGLETMPGLETIVGQRLGVATRDENGQLRDRATIFRDIVRSLSQMQGPLKYAMGRELFHIDPTTLDLLTGDKFQKFFDESLARHKNADDAVKDARELAAAQERLADQIENLKDRALVGLMNAWDKLSPQTKAVIKDYLDLDKQLGRLVWWWDHLTEGQRTSIKVGAAVVGVLAALVGGLGLLVVALTPVITGIGFVAGLLTGPIGLIALVAALAAGFYAFRKDLGWDDLVAGCEKFTGKVRELWGVLKEKVKPVASHVSDALKSVAPTPGDSSQPRGIRNNNPGNINYGEFARSQGSTGAEAAGRFAVFQTAQDGLNALGALLRSYAARGIDTIRSIISKYAPAGENNTEGYIANVAKRLGFGSDAHLNLSDPRLLAGLEQAIVQFENGKNPYSSDMYSSAANRAIGGASQRDVQITQHITTTVTGSSNPQEAAKALSSSLQTSNGLLTRNLQPRVQ